MSEINTAQLDAMRAALKDACDLLEGWVLTKCPVKYRGEHMQHIERLRTAGQTSDQTAHHGQSLAAPRAFSIPAPGTPWWQTAKDCGAWTDRTEGDLGYVHFGSTEALRVYTVKVTQQALAAQSAGLSDEQLYGLARAAGVLIVTQKEERAAINYGRLVLMHVGIRQPAAVGGAA